MRNQTPKEAWSGTKPSVDHFRIFGCLAYAHVPDVKRTKLDDTSLKCVLLDVSEESKAYRLYDPLSNKIVISRDVGFNEDGHWPWAETHGATVHASLDLEEEHTDSLDQVVVENKMPLASGNPGIEADRDTPPTHLTMQQSIHLIM